MFLPPDMAVQIPGAGPVHFRQALSKIFGDVDATAAQMAGRRPNKPTDQDVAEMSRHRCSGQALFDSLVHAVMRGVSDVIKSEDAVNWFWGRLPTGGVAALRQPMFYK